MNERGEGILALRTAADDPTGAYSILADPPFAAPEYASPNFVIGTADALDDLEGDEEGDKALALGMVEEANRVWAAVIAKDGAPISQLGRVFSGRELVERQREVEAMRAAGRYRTARLTAPIVVRGVRDLKSPELRGLQAAFGIEAEILEEWDDRLYNADGSTAAVYPSLRERRYVMVSSFSPWRIADADGDK